MSLATILAPLLLAAAGAADEKAALEPTYVEKLGDPAPGDPAALLEIAGWARSRGMIREMLHALGLVLERDGDLEAARRLLHQRFEDGHWVFDLPAPELARPAPLSDREREQRLQRARNQVFKMARKAFRFDLWTDIERDRVQEYVRVMNPYYEQVKGFFAVSRTEVGIPVLIFANRSDYLTFYNRAIGKSGEHTDGFFVNSGEDSYLCFHDDPYNSEAVLNTARHECTHLLVAQGLSDARMPHWLNEGLACYFAADADEWSGSYAAGCWITVRDALDGNRAITLQQLMDRPYEEFGFDCYATAWSWICYLRSDDGTRPRLSRFLSDLRALGRDESNESWEFSRWAKEADERFQEVVGRRPTSRPAGSASFTRSSRPGLRRSCTSAGGSCWRGPCGARSGRTR